MSYLILAASCYAHVSKFLFWGVWSVVRINLIHFPEISSEKVKWNISEDSKKKRWGGEWKVKVTHLTAFINKSRKKILVIKKKTFEVYLLFDTEKFIRILKARFYWRWNENLWQFTVEILRFWRAMISEINFLIVVLKENVVVN